MAPAHPDATGSGIAASGSAGPVPAIQAFQAAHPEASASGARRGGCGGGGGGGSFVGTKVQQRGRKERGDNNALKYHGVDHVRVGGVLDEACIEPARPLVEPSDRREEVALERPALAQAVEKVPQDCGSHDDAHKRANKEQGSCTPRRRRASRVQ